MFKCGYTLTGLNPGTSCSLGVKAFDTSGNISIMTQHGATTVPTNTVILLDIRYPVNDGILHNEITQNMRIKILFHKLLPPVNAFSSKKWYDVTIDKDLHIYLESSD